MSVTEASKGHRGGSDEPGKNIIAINLSIIITTPPQPAPPHNATPDIRRRTPHAHATLLMTNTTCTSIEDHSSTSTPRGKHLAIPFFGKYEARHNQVANQKIACLGSRDLIN
jgi:hypothetical protein